MLRLEEAWEDADDEIVSWKDDDTPVDSRYSCSLGAAKIS